MITFNYFDSNIKRSTPLGVVTLEQFIRGITNPKPNIREIFDKINECELNGDMKEKARLKCGLFSFTPCVLFKGARKYANISEFTGLMVLDFDHLTQEYAKEFKDFIFNTYDFIVASWLSASRCGVRCLVKIPKVSSTAEFKTYFNGIRYLEMAQYYGFDRAPLNAVLPLFLSHDPDLLYRPDPSTWTQTYSPLPNPPIPTAYKFDDNSPAVSRIISSSIHKIVDNGHPQLRAAAYALGGYVGAGLITHSEAQSLIHNLIRHNAYLSQKAPVYIETANTMILKGINTPLYL